MHLGVVRRARRYGVSGHLHCALYRTDTIRSAGIHPERAKASRCEPVVPIVSQVTDERSGIVTTPMTAAAIGAGGSSPIAPSTPSAAPTPITTRQDLEQNTYTAERSEKLREGNLSAK